MKIKILRNGDLLLLHTDAIPLREFGKVSVTRASEVEYDHGRDGWTVKFVSGGFLGEGDALADEAGSKAFASRAAALAGEVRYLEARL